jgi:CRISPR-associated protein Cmr2
MDGDGIGKRLSEENGKNVELIKSALAKFTKSVGAYFDPDDNKSLGALIYAGGDDVLALLPVDTAIEAACELEKRYKDAFSDKRADDQNYTISASIIYSHFKNPLSAALRQSALLLDDIAKEKNGRSSLALAVMKPGGLAAQWVSTFGCAVERLEELAKGNWGTREDSGLSGGFFHGLKQNCQPLFTGADGKASDFSNDDMLRSLVIAQMVNQFGGGEERRKAATAMIDPVMAVLRPYKRDEGIPKEAAGVAFDGGLIVRFLRNERRLVSV